MKVGGGTNQSMGSAVGFPPAVLLYTAAHFFMGQIYYPHDEIKATGAKIPTNQGAINSGNKYYTERGILHIRCFV